MLRIIIWRLSFDFWNLIAALLSRDFFLLLFPFLRSPLDRLLHPVNYFAFGANLDPTVLFERRRMRPLAQEEFILKNHTIRFNQQGPFEGMGFASVHAQDGEMVYGHLITLTWLDALRMDFSELTSILDRHRRVYVTQDGKRFYFYQATDPRAGLLPSEEYLQKILQAAEQSTLIPQSVLEKLRSTPTLTQLEPARNINFFFRDYSATPRFLEGARRWYDRICIKLLRNLIYVSWSTKLIKIEGKQQA
ncbi:hypothetical protein KFU94_50305 [Chloroflexi bacterium TSY]|nr:hypothetical protein [Chloroflexi bacterium TSY]